MFPSVYTSLEEFSVFLLPNFFKCCSIDDYKSESLEDVSSVKYLNIQKCRKNEIIHCRCMFVPCWSCIIAREWHDGCRWMHWLESTPTWLARLLRVSSNSLFQNFRTALRRWMCRHKGRLLWNDLRLAQHKGDVPWRWSKFGWFEEDACWLGSTQRSLGRFGFQSCWSMRFRRWKFLLKIHSIAELWNFSFLVVQESTDLMCKIPKHLSGLVNCAIKKLFLMCPNMHPSSQCVTTKKYVEQCL